MTKITITYTPPGQPFRWMQKIQDYLYEIYYDDIDYTAALGYYEEHGDPISGACSCVRSGNWFGRNYDWYYNHTAEFVVHTSAKNGRKASVSVAGGLDGLTEKSVSTYTIFPEYTILPFQVYDGINECGVFAGMNVVPTDYGTNVSIPEVVQKHKIQSRMLIRFILDRFETAKEAVEYIRDYVSVYFAKDLHEKHYEIHYMIGDATNLYILEFINNQAIIIDASGKPMMTNFYVSGVEFNADGTVYTPRTQTESDDAVRTNKITEEGCGLERYNAIVGLQPTANSHLAMRELMSSIRYSRAYPTYSDPASPVWDTEFVGNGLKCNSSVDKFDIAQVIAGEEYLARSRDKANVWQTAHSSVYDILHNTLYLVVQEDLDNEYKFVI